MAKAKSILEIHCPACDCRMTVDPETGAVLSHTVPEKPRTVTDLAQEVERLKGASAKREEAFQKSFAEHKVQKDVLAKKFDQLFKEAKDRPDAERPMRDIDLD